jgi:nitroreductase
MDPLRPIRRVSQVRKFTDETVSDDVVFQLLELARWTGSAMNSQPWKFIVIRDRETLRKIASLRPPMAWVATVPVAIAIVNDGAHPMFEAYDEGRLTERLLTGATLLGYGGGVAWFGEAQHQAKAKSVLGIPESLSARQIVAIGRPTSFAESRLPDLSSGRKALRDLVSLERYGTTQR